ncbi:MAG: cytidylate kinase-like family protein [Desulfobacterales bacterium]|nr:cytidylate kinase-like family protein [Desulfobacterales bacterium]MBF0395813.1 cytidylate kinase-like family protein [Desulfobacterales bacterium]
MQIICLSRGSYEYSKNLAEKLASKTGYTCISREMITDEATAFGIPVGKLEMAIMKKRPLSEEMSIEADLYKAFVTQYLCEKGLQQSIIYHGRTGHLVLPGLSNVLRVRAIADMDDRIKFAMNRLNLSWEKAKDYNELVDEDIRRWVRILYNVDWDDPSLYDVTINAAHLSAENAASALVQVAQLPEFMVTPVSKQRLEDLLLSSKCRLAIGKFEPTCDLKVTVRADKGNVSVTYLPRQTKEAEMIPKALKDIKGIKSLVCTIATTNILYIAEQFNPGAEAFDHLINIAEKWNASVELVHLSYDSKQEENGDNISEKRTKSKEANGGILDDMEEVDRLKIAGCGVQESMNKLIQVGRSGGFHSAYGSSSLVNSISRTENNSLIVVGDVFHSKGAAKKRLKRDLISQMADKFHVPVIGTEDLKSHYLFGPKQLISLVVSGVFGVILYLTIFLQQEPILKFLSSGHIPSNPMYLKIAAAATLAVSVPIIAHIIGGFFENILKLAKLE